jgi:hypothetical protein
VGVGWGGGQGKTSLLVIVTCRTIKPRVLGPPDWTDLVLLNSPSTLGGFTDEKSEALKGPLT